MFGLRQKLAMGFGGLLLILLIVSSLGIAVLRQHRSALDEFLYENWRSVEYGQAMIGALDRLDDRAMSLAAGASAGTTTEPAAARRAALADFEEFDANLKAENRNLTLPGEDRLATALTDLWSGPDGYRILYAQLADPATPPQTRLELHTRLTQLSPRVKAAAQALIHLNLDNMKPIDGRVKAIADNTSRLMLLLAGVGVTVAVLLIAFMSRSILLPVQALTRSARQIEKGDLDLVVQVHSRDELRQLAEAFNSMAAKLREYRRTNQAKLARTQQTTQNAINSLPDAVAILSPEGRIEMANKAAQQLFAIRPDAHVSEVHAQWLGALFNRTATELRPIEPRGYESAIQVLDEGGAERFFLPHAVPIIDAGRRLMGVTVVLADVTHLRRLDEMKSGMLSVVRHELKTPLTSIRMGVHLLLEERIGTLTDQQSELLVAVRDDSDRLHRIVENLLDMSRIESGRAMLDLAPARPERLAADAAEAMGAAFGDKGVDLAVEISPDAPEVLADGARVGHVFSNLLSNALRYTPPGGRVRVWVKEDDSVVRFCVTDTGPGIPAACRDRIFERFFRVPGQPANTGAGLGLAIAKEIVEAHGGSLAVESQEGEGSTVSFTLRRAPAGRPDGEATHVYDGEPGAGASTEVATP